MNFNPNVFLQHSTSMDAILPLRSRNLKNFALLYLAEHIFTLFAQEKNGESENWNCFVVFFDTL